MPTPEILPSDPIAAIHVLEILVGTNFLFLTLSNWEILVNFGSSWERWVITDILTTITEGQLDSLTYIFVIVGDNSLLSFFVRNCPEEQLLVFLLFLCTFCWWWLPYYSCSLMGDSLWEGGFVFRKDKFYHSFSKPLIFFLTIHFCLLE